MIAPPSLATLNTRTGLALALPLLSQRSRYADAIKNNFGRTILDNGAAEDQPTDMEELLRLGKEWGVHEIVLPDILGKAKATLSASKDALKVIVRHGAEYEF